MIVSSRKDKVMNRYATGTDFLTMPLAQIEKTLESYLKIAEGSDWDISPEFERELSMLTSLAKAKGSTRKW
jgi:hypothetical protein